MLTGVCGLTDEVGLAGVDGVLQLVGGDAELVLGRPVHGDGVVGRRTQLVSDGRRVGSWFGAGGILFIPVHHQLRNVFVCGRAHNSVH